ncbi:MAG: hypothetical protein LAO03_11990 [Acidobacteriia bacterium]|nr:hypothetical protein [Terriglobia bacterium]
MKNKLRTLLGLGLVLVAASAFAQTIRVKADIPFNFIVDKQTLPAGEYTVKSMDMAGSSLSIRNKDEKPLSLVLSLPCEKLAASQNTKLVFHRYGDQYFLAQIWVAGSAAGHQLLESRQEIELARDSAAKDVTVTASLR